jgi:hypothetical protein
LVVRGEDPTRLHHIFKGQDVFSGLHKKATVALQAKKGELYWPQAVLTNRPEYVPPVSAQISTGFQRIQFSPRNTDYSCKLRHFHAMPIRDRVLTEGRDLGMAATDVRAFSSKPMAPLGLEQYVLHLTRSQQKLPTVSDRVPFDVSKHVSAGSHVAQKMTARLRNDAAVFAKRMNEEAAPQLIGLLHEDVRVYVSDPASEPAQKGLARAMDNVKRLLKVRRHRPISLSHLPSLISTTTTTTTTRARAL